MPGVLLPNGGRLYGEGDAPALCGGWNGDGVLLPNGGRMGGAADCAPLIAEAFWYITDRYGIADNQGTAGIQLNGRYVYLNPGQQKAAIYYGTDAASSTTPDAADLDITGDFTIALDLWALWEPPLPCEFVAKPLDGDDTDDCYAVGVGVDGYPFIEFTRSGETTHEAFSFFDVDYSGETDRKQLVFEFDADNGAGGWTANLYAGTPGDVTLLESIVNTTDGAVTIETSSMPLEIGKPIYGSVYRSRLYTGTLDSLDLVSDFYPEADWVSGTTMTADTGEVWSNLWVPAIAGFVAVQVPDNPTLDIGASADATYAFSFTTPFLADTDGEVYQYASRATGTLGFNGNGYEIRDAKIDAFMVDIFGALVGDGSDQALAVDNTWTAGGHVVAFTVDRDSDDLTVYVDGAVYATGDISAVGAMNPDADLLMAVAIFFGAAAWDRVLTPTEIASLNTLL